MLFLYLDIYFLSTLIYLVILYYCIYLVYVFLSRNLVNSQLQIPAWVVFTIV